MGTPGREIFTEENDKACLVNYETALLTWISHHKDNDVKLLQIIA